MHHCHALLLQLYPKPIHTQHFHLQDLRQLHILSAACLPNIKHIQIYVSFVCSFFWSFLCVRFFRRFFCLRSLRTMQVAHTTIDDMSLESASKHTDDFDADALYSQQLSSVAMSNESLFGWIEHELDVEHEIDPHEIDVSMQQKEDNMQQEDDDSLWYGLQPNLRENKDQIASNERAEADDVNNVSHTRHSECANESQPTDDYDANKSDILNEMFPCLVCENARCIIHGHRSGYSTFNGSKIPNKIVLLCKDCGSQYVRPHPAVARLTIGSISSRGSYKCTSCGLPKTKGCKCFRKTKRKGNIALNTQEAKGRAEFNMPSKSRQYFPPPHLIVSNAHIMELQTLFFDGSLLPPYQFDHPDVEVRTSNVVPSENGAFASKPIKPHTRIGKFIGLPTRRYPDTGYLPFDSVIAQWEELDNIMQSDYAYVHTVKCNYGVFFLLMEPLLFDLRIHAKFWYGLNSTSIKKLRLLPETFPGKASFVNESIDIAKNVALVDASDGGIDLVTCANIDQGDELLTYYGSDKREYQRAVPEVTILKFMDMYPMHKQNMLRLRRVFDITQLSYALKQSNLLAAIFNEQWVTIKLFREFIAEILA
jgi:hypothetical protein